MPDIKWTPGPPPEPRNKTYLCFFHTADVTGLIDVFYPEDKITGDINIKSHALINYPLTINEAR